MGYIEKNEWIIYLCLMILISNVIHTMKISALYLSNYNEPWISMKHPRDVHRL